MEDSGKRISSAKIFFILSLSFISGIALASFFHIPFFFVYLSFLFLLIILVFCWSSFYWRIIVLGGVFLILGVFRYYLDLPKIDDKKISFYNQKGQIVFQGVVIQEPDIRQNYQQLVVEAEKVGKNKPVSGKVLIKTKLYPQYNYGDKLIVSGRLKRPKKFKSFDYQGYLSRFHIYSLCYYPKIKVVKRGEGNKFYNLLINLKKKIHQTIISNLPGPQAGFLSAILLGYRHQISSQLRNYLSRTGTAHLAAISGLHITIMTAILMTFLIGLGLKRDQAFYFVVLFLFLFIMMIGFPASAVRAGIMAFLILLAMKLGRLSRATNALIFTALIMLLFNPKLLKNDLGFQLSFLSVLGIISLFPVLEKWFRKIPQFSGIRQSVQITLSAQLYSFPLVVFTFHQLPLFSTLVNLLILPLFPLLIISGFVSSFLTLLFSDLGRIFFFVPWFILSYIFSVIKFFGSQRFSFLVIKDFSFVYLIIIYFFLGIIFWLIDRKEKLFV